MKNLIRGGAMLSVMGLCVVFIYAQSQAELPLVIADDSQAKIENNNSNNIDPIFLSNTLSYSDTKSKKASSKTTKGTKKLVKTTASVRSTSAGAARGSFSATAYCLSGRTAMGHSVRRGIVAADPRVLKLGSSVYVEAGPWSGNYLVSDTGGAVKGKKIDIWVPSCSEARRFGRRSVNVFTAQ